VIRAARQELVAVGIERPPEVVVADGGYWNVPQIERLIAAGSQVIVNPDSSARPARIADGRRLRDKRVHGLYLHMQRVITSPHGAALYRLRQQMIEPVFAQTKVTRRADRFQRRGFNACRSEWRLIAATHNLLSSTDTPSRPHSRPAAPRTARSGPRDATEGPLINPSSLYATGSCAG
jgi:hypothetical protein